MVNRLISNRWWVRVLSIFIVARLLSVLLFLAVGATEGGSYWNHPNPDYWDFLNVWDVEWFGKIFNHGYPATIPTDLLGNVQQNAWAFLPAYPFTVKAVSVVTGLSWKFAAPLVSTLAAAVFSLIAYRLFAIRLTAKVSLWAIAIISFSPPSPVFQTGYSESLGLALIAAVLYFWLTDRFIFTVVALTALAFTRPGLAAFALAFGVVWLIRFWQSRMGGRSFGLTEALRLGALALISLLLNFAWPFVAAIVTGRPDAYVVTELAWRSAFPFGGGGLIPLAPWFSSAQYFVGGVAGVALVASALLAAALTFFIPQVRKLGLELNVWVASYFAYLFLFFFPQSSIVRILMPAFVLAGALALGSANWSRNRKTLLVVLLIGLQILWLLVCWRYQAPDFSPP
jgi:hypothetical protein